MPDIPLEDITDEHFYPPPEPWNRVADVARRPRPVLPRLTLGQAAWLLVAAILADIAIRSGVASISSTLAVVVIVGALLNSGVRQNNRAMAFAAAALIFAAWLPLRASAWLTSLNASAVVTLLIAAAISAQPHAMTWTTRTLATLLSRILLARFFVFVLGLAAAPLRSMENSRLVPVIRGALLACLPVLVLGALLASADVVFAQSISIDIEPGGFFAHAFLTAIAACALAGLVAMTSRQGNEDFGTRRPLGATEALVVLLSVGALFAAFALVQLLGALGRTDDILREQGVTYASYARSGFFQLLWVAGLTLGVLAMVRLFVADGSRYIDQAVRVAGASVALLTTLIVAVAIVRLGLYTDEFGQTTLRWYCTAFAWMLGAVFVLVAGGHLRQVEAKLPMALGALVAGTLFAVNVLNPEARVAEHNLTRLDAATTLDAAYLAELSADAWPQLIDHAQLVQSRLVSDEFDRGCQEASQTSYGLFGFNLARVRLAELC